jgi:tetratricopeptide (TPR) repeat protein
MKALSEQGCKWNFEQKLLLLTAEESFCLGDLAAAKESYKNAIAAAKNHKFLNDECFALEITANFYFETGDLQSSLEHLRQAYDKYNEWGAHAKAINCSSRSTKILIRDLIGYFLLYEAQYPLLLAG